MRNATLLLLIKKDGDKVSDICLAMKKRGFGAGRYNGAGGKVEEDESIEDAVVRELKEEFDVLVKELDKRAEVSFTFPHMPSFDQIVHVYYATEWEGEPTETEEMNPKWFKVEDIPYNEMWPDDIFWLPKVLEGGFVNGRFILGEGDVVKEHEVIVS